MIVKKFEDLGYPKQPLRKELPWIHMILQEKYLDKIITISYDKDVHIYEVIEMEKKYCFEIPYGERSKWIERCYSLTKLIGKQDMLSLFVSNNPHHLKSYLTFTYTGNDNAVRQFCKENHIDLVFDKGVEEMIKDMRNRMWNDINFFQDMDFQSFSEMFSAMFYFEEISELNRKGYEWNHEHTRNKVFISYSWKNKAIVREIVEQLQDSGINVFIDQQSIDYGDHILEKIQSGLKECDLAIFFISNDFKESHMAKYELKSIWTKVIDVKKKWMMVRLDDVDPDDIQFSLGDYKYFDCTSEPVEDFIEAVHEKIKS